MAAEPQRVHEVVGRLSDLGDQPGEVEPLLLTADERARGHLRARTERGRELLISLPRGQELEDGDVLWVEDGAAVVVAAAAEDVLEATPADGREWGRVAYQLGNLHRPVRFTASAILTPYESSSEELLRALRVSYRRLERGLVGERPRSLVGGHGHSHGA